MLVLGIKSCNPFFATTQLFSTMAPKQAMRRAKARPKARGPQWVRRSNNRRQLRAEACKVLNALANEVGVESQQLLLRGSECDAVERLVRLLEARATQPGQLQRLQQAASQWQANGGVFSLHTLAEEVAGPACVARHRVLERRFELKSKAFMLTYNGRIFTQECWPEFRDFIAALKGRLGARAWAACLEASLHSSDAGRVHLHAYLLWNDGVGIHHRCLDEFLFRNVRPRIDVCVCRASPTSVRSAACHGLWY